MIKTYEEVHFSKVFHRCFDFKLQNLFCRATIFHWLLPSFTVPSLFLHCSFNVCFFTFRRVKIRTNRKIMASSCSAKICIWYGDKENHPLNHVGAQCCDDQNEKLPLKTILKQAHGLKLNNIISNIAKHFPNKTPILINLSCRNYLRNKFCPRNWLIEDAQQSSVKRVARRSDPHCMILKTNVFTVGKVALKTKNILIEKTLKLLEQ